MDDDQRSSREKRRDFEQIVQAVDFVLAKARRGKDVEKIDALERLSLAVHAFARAY